MLRLAFLSLLTFSLSAQTITATLTGAVPDPQGAAVPARRAHRRQHRDRPDLRRGQRLRGPLQRPVSRARNLLALSHREGFIGHVVEVLRVRHYSELNGQKPL